ncbi:MAG: putative bifunctional diguanylate cyclase/phosphodiesterase [Mycobacteriaceae bacterium]
MRHENELSAVLGEFARTLLTDFPIQGILDHLVKRIVEALPVTSVGITLISPGAAPRYIAASDDAALLFETMQTRFEEGPCMLAHESGHVVEVPDLSKERRFPRYVAAATEAGLAAAFAFPLKHGAGRLGSLDLYRSTPGPLDPDDTRAARTLADVAAAYILNAQARDAARKTADRFRASALHDPLTGLPNRVLLQQRLVQAAERGERECTSVAVLFADLDRFKQVNDTYGHQVGDELLVAVAHRLSDLVRPGDTLARVSGDEFVFLCEGLVDGADIEAFARRIEAAFTAPFVLSGVELSVTASVGMAYTEPGEAVSNQLVVDADIAMYQAKRKGGATHQVIDLGEARRRYDRNTLEQDLHTAFARDELHIAYQPVVRSIDGLIVGVEALLRWTHPDRGPVPALDMVSIAEDDGLITQIGAWVLERSCTDRRRWLHDHPDMPLSLAVNVSVRQLMSPHFSNTVAAVLDTTEMDPAALVLEITEGVFIQDAARATKVMAELKQLGVRLALDDFGTGYSSLSYLRQYPFDILKIDQIFLATMGRDPAAAAIVAAIANLAHALGLSVIAEGVETQEQRKEIIALGCEFAQGFLYSTPIPARELASLLQSSSEGELYLLPPDAA